MWRTLSLTQLSLILLLLGAAPVWPVPAHAQVRRCVDADGAVVFTDHQCSDIGSVERAPPAVPLPGNNNRAFRGCARTLQDLMFEMTSAFEAHDANRLAGIYHWAGMSGDSAYSILERLDALVQRPFVDVVPVMPTSAADGDNSDAGGGASAADGNYYPQTSVRKAPVALRVEQTLANGITPSRTVFGLRKYLGCLWLQL
jgi:hypothetical protein